MHIMIVADGRSPTTRRWIASLCELGYRLTLVSSFPCAPLAGIEATYVLPVAFGGLAGNQAGSGSANPRSANQGPRQAVSRFRSMFMSARYVLGPLTLGSYRKKLSRMVDNLRPDLVHSMRIPFEGMLASRIPSSTPLAISVWGNDLTLHAHGSMQMKNLTHQVLQRANGLIADTRRDIRLGRAMGFNEENPALVVPGCGGINLEEIERIRLTRLDPLTDFVPAGVPLVVNPRGFRPGSVRNDVFFESIPMVLKRNPRVAFLCPAMAGQPEAMRAIEKYQLNRSLYLLPHLPQSQLWDLFLRATMMASISQHDGTPNSLLEAMACGCFPVAGDIESIREWITPGVNGLLVEPSKPAGVADAILTALESAELRRSAAEMNKKLISSQADVNLVREKVKNFYEGLC